MTNKLLHLSDLHGHFPKDLYKYSGDIIITGDMMDDGTAYEARILAEKLTRKWAGIVHIIPGNHDYGIRGNFFDAEAVKRFDVISSALQVHRFANKKIYVEDCREFGYMILGLNTCRMTESITDSAQGEFGETQLTDLSICLDDKKDKTATVFIAFHHHLFWNSRFTKLRDAKKFLMIVKTYSAYYKNIVLLFGHKHEKSHVKLGDNIHAIAAPATRLAGEAMEITITDGELSFGVRKVKFYG